MDNNYRSIADTDGVVIKNETICPDGADNFSDILKFSNASNCTVTGTAICGGKEDCVDMNRNCKNITLLDCTLFTNGNQHATIKGGAKDITLNNVLFRGNPKNVEIELGNYSEQSDEPPERIFLENCNRDDGSPVRVRLLNCCDCQVIVIGGNVKVFKPWWVKMGFFELYCYLRKKNIIKK